VVVGRLGQAVHDLKFASRARADRCADRHWEGGKHFSIFQNRESAVRDADQNGPPDPELTGPRFLPAGRSRRDQRQHPDQASCDLPYCRVPLRRSHFSFPDDVHVLTGHNESQTLSGGKYKTCLENLEGWNVLHQHSVSGLTQQEHMRELGREREAISSAERVTSPSGDAESTRKSAIDNPEQTAAFTADRMGVGRA